MAATSSHTHSHVVDSHADSSVVINLLSGDGFGLIGQEDSQQQKQALIAVHHS